MINHIKNNHKKSTESKGSKTHFSTLTGGNKRGQKKWCDTECFILLAIICVIFIVIKLSDYVNEGKMTRTEILLNNNLYRLETENSTAFAVEFRPRYLQKRNATSMITDHPDIIKLREKHINSVAEITPLMGFRTWALFEIQPIVNDTNIISHQEFSESVKEFIQALSKTKFILNIEF